MHRLQKYIKLKIYFYVDIIGTFLGEKFPLCQIRLLAEEMKKASGEDIVTD